MAIKLLKICLVCLLAPHFVQGQQQTTPSLVSIEWDQSTLKQVAPHGNYARMIQLSDGNLFCVYESSGGVVSSISNDLGNTWQTPIVIAQQAPGVNMNVPDILELKDHSLLASYNPRPHKINGDWDTTKHFAIVTKKSYDKGKTWQDERLIYEASYKFDDGCWEPTQIQLPSGEVQLYFSNEGVYTHSGEQNISVFRSKDNGLTWTKQPEIVSFRPGHRDGMPIPIILKGKKEIAFSIEDNAGGQFKPSIIRNSFAQNWQKTVGANDAGRTYALTPKLPDTIYAGAPFLRQLHSGETILSYQSTMGRGHNWEQACMQVTVGNSNAENFISVPTPFNVPVGKHGLWNSLCVLNDDTIIALTSTNAYGDSNAVWMIKGRLVKKR
ncbi:BNR repeat-like domain-containing protein [Mucilaginibacter pineti]|uniref:BNR repeat-like domain-containing protein n=1 Tax=Mucilaginibacter pineti TaxID=1391627 RepID=A0A1G7HGX7_9SPHI|nr:sialidase family protein [Mucilaginibacter pineti]SDE99611.1 BNR repeat-like domain-containing protein [Mucilaginibacter pineti]